MCARSSGRAEQGCIVSAPASIRRIAACVLACALAACAKPNDTVTGRPVPGVALRAVSGEPCVGCDTLPYNGMDAYLKPSRLATASDIEQIETITNPGLGMPIVRILFKPESEGKMLRVTTELQGQVLAWVVDDTVVSIATVAEPFGCEMQLSGIDAKESKRSRAHDRRRNDAASRGSATSIRVNVPRECHDASRKRGWMARSNLPLE
jgi:hypothetical protein